MNYVYRLKPRSYNPATSTLPIQDFFIKHEFTEHHRVSRRVEKMIEKFSLKLFIHGEVNDSTDEDLFMMLAEDFERLIDEIRQIYLSKNYAGLVSRLIIRAFVMTPGIKRNLSKMASLTNHNRALLLKTLYDVNPECFLLCFVSGTTAT